MLAYKIFEQNLPNCIKYDQFVVIRNVSEGGAVLLETHDDQTLESTNSKKPPLRDLAWNADD